jgi:hypothetical protein
VKLVEMKLLRIREAGVLDFENVDASAAIDVPHPVGEEGRRLRDYLRKLRGDKS